MAVTQGGQTLASTTTDAYGDFRLDGLKPKSGSHELTVSHPQRGTLVRHFDLGDQSVVLPDLELRP